MGLFDNFAKKASDIASQAAQAAQKGIEKSGDLVEIGRLNLNIKGEEDKIGRAYAEIGKVLYDRYKESGVAVDQSFVDMFSQIDASNEIIQSFKDKIAQINAGGSSPQSQEEPYEGTYSSSDQSNYSGDAQPSSAVEPITPVSPPPAAETAQTIEPIEPINKPEGQEK